MVQGGDVFKMPRFPFGGRSGLRWGVEWPIFPLHLGSLIMYNEILVSSIFKIAEYQHGSGKDCTLQGRRRDDVGGFKVPVCTSMNAERKFLLDFTSNRMEQVYLFA